jgi:SepF-like predicted cell division protein (DUF552 family)
MTERFLMCLSLLMLCFNVSATTESGSDGDDPVVTEKSPESTTPDENIKKLPQEEAVEKRAEELISVSEKEDVSHLGGKQKIGDPVIELIRLEKEKDERNLKILNECVNIANKFGKSLDALGIAATASVDGNTYPAKKNQFGNSRTGDLFNYPDITAEEARTINNSQILGPC